MDRRQSFRAVAVIGPVLVVLGQAWGDSPLAAGQRSALIVSLLLVAAALLTMRLLLRDAVATILREKDILVPLGLLVTCQGLLGLLLALPAMAAVLSPTTTFRLLGISYTLSVGGLLQILLRTIYAAWAVIVVIRVMRGEPVDPPGALSEGLRWLPRIFGFLAIGWIVLFAGIGFLGVLIASLGEGGLILLLAVALVGSLVWNFATAAVLLLAPHEGLRFQTAFRAGVGASIEGKRLWWKQVLAQLLLLGILTFLSVSTSQAEAGAFRQQTSTNWNVNLIWIGGFSDDCKWYDRYVELTGAEGAGWMSTILGIAFGILALAVKLDMAAKLGASATAALPCAVLSGSRQGEGASCEATPPSTGEFPSPEPV